MADLIEYALRFSHITFAIAWIGATFYAVGVLSRVMPRLEGPARKQVMVRLLPVALRYIPLTAVLTIVLGATLYLYMGKLDPDLLLGSRWGLTLLAAFVLALGTFGFGMVYVIGSARKIQVHLGEEQCGHGPEVATLQKRFARGQPIVMVLGLIIIGLMVAASRGL